MTSRAHWRALRAILAYGGRQSLPPGIRKNRDFAALAALQEQRPPFAISMTCRGNSRRAPVNIERDFANIISSMDEEKPPTLEYEPEDWARESKERIGYLIDFAIRVAVLVTVIELLIHFLF